MILNSRLTDTVLRAPRRGLGLLVGAWLLAANLFAAGEFEVRLGDGATFSGQLQQIDRARVALTTANGTREVELSQVALILPAQQESAPGPAASPGNRLELQDGSSTTFQSFELTGGKVRLGTAAGLNLELSFTGLRQIQFRTHDGALAKQWKEIESARRSGDALVIRKAVPRAEGAAGGESESLDYLEGIVREVTSSVVKFEFDGDQIDVKRDRVDGIVFSRLAERTKTAPLCRLGDTAGAKWNLADVTYTTGVFHCRTMSGVEFDLAEKHVARIDFSTGSVLHLSLEEVEDSSWNDFSDRLVGRLPSLQRRYAPQYVAGDGEEPIWLNGRSFQRGWLLYPVTRLVFRIPEDGFARLRGTVGIDDRSRGGDVVLAVLGDGRELAQRTFRAADKEVWELDLAIAGLRRIELRVTTGAGRLQYGQLDLGDLRITK